MEITTCTKQDFDQIILEFSEFWDHDRTVALHHPTLINEFGNTAFVAKEGDKVLAYLFGFISQTEPVGYAQLLAVRQGYRRLGLAGRLYAYFEAYARSHGCNKLKATTSPVNSLSIAFHKSIGMMPTGNAEKDGVQVVKDYAGPGKDRVVFIKDIDLP
ncbi:MAG: GNAT family N-acetyltransferase [Dehalococcoidia bacterium]|nr:GNAT family N-acetyltransferase [Dehalococcoidia bacterium]MDD5493208.1 GNAT family N-acetyltransferase [Dehalococcoidia bacterium]